jgi:hypothetical protein
MIWQNTGLEVDVGLVTSIIAFDHRVCKVGNIHSGI